MKIRLSGPWIEVEFAKMEVDHRLHSLRIAEAAGSILDANDPTVDALGQAVTPLMIHCIEDAPQVLLDHPCYLLDWL